MGACSTSEKPEENSKTTSDELKKREEKTNLICINHSLLVLDPTTYEAAVNSEFLKSFAFSHEKRLKGYHGFYLIGKTNYLEMFDPNSFDGEILEPGTISIYLASLKANYLKKLSERTQGITEFTSEDDYHYLFPIIKDTVSEIRTWEMRKVQYESWTKKKYHDSVTFLPVDYNSPEESDSSSNYLMNDIIGIGLSLNPDDSSAMANYLKEIGYDSVSEHEGRTRFSSNDQFVELYISKTNKLLTINRYYIRLNESVDKRTEIIGNSRIECDGKSAVWFFDHF